MNTTRSIGKFPSTKSTVIFVQSDRSTEIHSILPWLILLDLNVSASETSTCTAPFVDVGGIGCFYLASEHRGWFFYNYDVAVEVCERDGGKLAIVDTSDKNTLLKDNLIFGSK